MAARAQHRRGGIVTNAMTQTATSYENYRSDFRELESVRKDGDPSWLLELRRESMDRFLEMGFPTARRGNEPWKYTNVAPIAKGAFRMPMNGAAAMPDLDAIKAVAPWHDDWTTLVFVDGTLSRELSSDFGSQSGVTIASLSDALASDGTLLAEQMSRYADFKADAFIALNTAFVRDGAYIVVNDGATVDRPIHLLFISTGAGGPSVTYPRVLVVAQPNSSATLIESYIGLSDDEYFTDSVTEIVLEEGARLDHYRLLLEGVSSYHVGMVRVRQNDDSTYECSVFERQAGSLGRFDMYNELAGERSVCTHNGLYFTDGKQHMDNYININHVAPHCTSRLYYKGILDGRSRAVFGGTVYVQPGAMKTDSMQQDKNLVLSPYAEVDSKPALFIYADDVKCGHGATAGNIDMDTVFYMRSRGLDLETASRFLIYGFAAEIIDKVREDHLRGYLEELFLSSLPSYSFEF